MTSRNKSAVRGFETEIEKCREEGNWKRSVELATQLKARSPQHESLANFLIGEGELEAYLERQGLAAAPGAAGGAGAGADAALAVARGWLERAAGEEGRRAGVALDAHLLLGKLHFARGDAGAALHHFDRAELSTLTEKELPVRSLRIVAESFAIRALCLEEAEGGACGEEAARCVEAAAALGALYAQRGGGGGGSAGPVLGGALAAAPRLHVRAGRPQRAADACRDLLAAVEAPATSPLRPGLARQLAELLLRAPATVYRPPAGPQGPGAAAQGPWRPRRYAAPNQFVPRAPQEELLLALLLAEAMAARDAVLSQSAEFAHAREHALRNAVAVVDLLALAAARWGLLCLVREALERAMKFSFGSRHVWRQRALAGAAAAPGPPAGTLVAPAPPPPGSEAWAAGVRAAAVLARACALAPDDAALRLVAAHASRALGRLEESAAWAQRACDAAQGGPLQARAALAAGAAWQALAARARGRPERAHADARALELLLAAVRLDDNDHVALYHLALQLARAGRLDDALDATRACLWARADCEGGLRLAAALWSAAGAGARRERALHAARLARDQFPAREWPLAALGVLLAAREPDAALAAGRALVALLARAGAADAPAPPYAELDARSEAAEEALSAREGGGASSAASSGAGGAGGGGANAGALEGRRAHAWLALGELLLRLGRAPAAAGCVAEAAALAPAHHLVFYTRGRVQAATGEWACARLSFTDALALRPEHADSLLQLGGALYALGWPRLAEGALRSALAGGGGCSAEAWRRLALVLAALGEPAAAADAAAAALHALPAQPALPLPTPVPL